LLALWIDGEGLSATRLEFGDHVFTVRLTLVSFITCPMKNWASFSSPAL